MTGYMMIALAEQRLEDLRHEARIARPVPRHRSGRRPSMRSWLSRARTS
jgi:hypothetical protein